jgi:hypothetical protein
MKRKIGGRKYPHLPQYTKHRRNKGQFKRKKNHWADKK